MTKTAIFQQYEVTYNMLGNFGLKKTVSAYFPAHAATILRRMLPYAVVVGVPALIGTKG